MKGKLVVTGALGHIGSAFIRSLARNEYREVVLLDNLSTQRYCSLFNLPDAVPFRFVEDDISTAPLERHFEGADAVVHLAAITDAPRSFELKDDVWRVNHEGAERVARACAAAGSRMIFLSTTSVYGKADGIVDEECSADELQPQSPYAESKLRAEDSLRALSAQGLRCVIFRFGTIAGASIGMRFHTAVNKFAWQACLGIPITVWRTALHQKRPYLSLRDAVRALAFVLARDTFPGGTYNVVTQNATVAEILEMIGRHAPDLRVEHVDSPIMNQLSYEVSAARFEAAGFRSTSDLPEAIAETMALIQALRASRNGRPEARIAAPLGAGTPV